MTDPRDIFKRFSESARRVLVSSQKIAETMKTGIGSDHMLLAMTITSGNLAFELLKENMVNIDQIRLIIRFNNIKSVHGQGLSAEAKNILDIATKKTVELKEPLVEPEHILWAMCKEKESLAYKIIAKIGIDIESLLEQIEDIFDGSMATNDLLNKPVDNLFQNNDNNSFPMFFGGNIPQMQKTQVVGNRNSKTPTLDFYGSDLTALARDNKIDPVIGREREISRVIQILLRKNKNNPVLVGEPGVGKTAIVEGLARRINAGLVPTSLKQKRLISLDLAMIVAGTMYRGQFEERLKKIIDEIKKSNEIILFIDEVHTIVGTGSAEGSMDTANILKPSLAKGQIRLIGATTNEEFRKYIEKDSALERRLQQVKVDEPSIEESIKILKGLRPSYEQHHQVVISDEAIETAVNLSKRYINDKYLPDKALDLIDEASSSVQVKNHSLRKNKKLILLEDELKKVITKKDIQVDKQDYEEAAKLKAEEIKLRFQIEKIENLEKEKALKKNIEGIDIAKMVNIWTGIPVDNIYRMEKLKLINLENILKEQVIGQEDAIKIVSDSIKRAKSGITDPNRPLGAYIFLGPTGVGKTELARILSKEVYGGIDTMIKIDMSEFMEKHNLSRLVGAPPGYVGYDDAGKLTEQVRKNPYSLILLDEIEKAHPEIFNILLQILEDGYLTDAKGRKINFKNTIIIMTSNIGVKELNKTAALGFDTKKDDKSNTDFDKMKSSILKDLKNTFKPELINRLDKTIVFRPLDKEAIYKIIDLQIKLLNERLISHNISLSLDKNVKQFILKKGYDPEYGARPIKRAITEHIENLISENILNGVILKGDKINIHLDKDKLNFSKV